MRVNQIITSWHKADGCKSGPELSIILPSTSLQDSVEHSLLGHGVKVGQQDLLQQLPLCQGRH